MPLSIPSREQGGRPGFAGIAQRRTASLIGAIVVAGGVFVLGLWATVFMLIASEHRTAVAHARTDARNLSAAFQAEVGRELDSIATAMDLVAVRMRAAPGALDLHAWASQMPLVPAAATQAAIIGPDGRLASTTADPHPKPIDWSNREDFRVHLDGTYRGLFIGKPVTGPALGEVTFPVTRRVDAADGRFLGVIAFSVAPALLTTLQRAINLGPHDLIALFGTDSVIRARFSGDSPNGTAGIGVSVRPPAAGEARASGAGGGARDGTHIAESPVDHVVRVYSDRRLAGYPLFVAVGLGLDEVLAPARAHARQIEAAASAVTLLLCGLLAALITEVRRRARHEVQLAHERSALAADIVLRIQAEHQLREKDQRFQDIAEVSGDWIWETDAAHRFTFLATDAFAERTGLTAVDSVGRTRWELAPGDLAQQENWRRHKAELDAHQPFRRFRYTITSPAGTSPAGRSAAGRSVAGTSPAGTSAAGTSAAGEVRHIAVSGKPVFGASGDFLGYRGTATNETPMVEALHRAEQAETLLRDATDSISEGFVIYDSDDRLVLCNEAYRRMYPASAPLMVPGVTFETLARNTLASGHYPEAAGQEEEWLARFLKTHREAVGDIETQGRDGTWILVAERRMRNGGLAGVRVDISESKRIQAALRESEQRLRGFAEMASDWFWEEDAEGRFVWISEGSASDSMPSQPYIGKTRWTMAPDGATPEQWEAHRADLAARRPFRDFRYCRTDTIGRMRHISIHGAPTFAADGAFAGYRGTGRDITAQIEAEQELEQAKERAEQAETLLRDAMNSMSEGFVIFDRDDRFVMCNDTYRQIYADGADYLVPGVSFDDLIRLVVAKGGNLDARGREAEWLADRVRQHREAKGSMEHQRANGCWYLATDRPMKNGGIAGLRIDITALKQAQAALRESEARLDRAQAIAGIGSWELDVATGHYIWSKELYRIRGVSPETFEPDIDNVAQYVHQDDYPVVRRWLANLMQGLEQNPLEPRIVRPDGEVRVLRVEGRAVTGPDATVRQVAGTMQDVTERRLIERQLMQAQKMEAIGNLTGGMAHDFNNVLGVVIGNLDLLKRLVRDDAAAAELCGEALDGASRCADLIRRLLAFARRQSLRPEVTDLNALVGDVARLLGRILGEDIVLNLHLDAALRPVLADPSQLEAALVNFATNARDAMPKGGRLDVSTSNVVLDAGYTVLHPDVSPGAYVCIEISDTGAGIPPEIMGRIFEPFFTTKEPGRGTGLGLAMAFGFVKQSGGHLTVYSERGLGTTFRLYLPSTAAADAAQAAQSDAGTGTGGDATVLVVEDNAPLRQATVRQLTGLGYRVLQAENAEAAVATLSGAQVDLLFTDVVMPGSMDGLDLAHHAVSLCANLKVLLTSGFPGVRGADQRVADCPFPMLGKPFRRDELARAVLEVLDAGDDQPNAPIRRFASAGGRQYDDAQAGGG